MEKIKKLFEKISSSIKEMYVNYPITMVIIYIGTILFAFGEDWFKTEVFNDVVYYLGMIGAAALFSETFLVTQIKNAPKKMVAIAGTIIGIIVAVLFDAMGDLGENELLGKFNVLYLVYLGLAILYTFIKTSELSFKEYVIKLFNNILNVTIIYVILTVGFIILTAIFVELILDGDYWDFLGKVIIFIVGWFYLPSFIFAYTNMKNDVSSFFKMLVKMVLTPIMVIALAIIYMYIVKIIITGEFLKNSLFFICALVYCFTIPISIMASNYTEDGFFKNVVKVLTYGYLPLIVLEIMAMSVRTGTYGITESRYYAYIFITLQIIAFCLLNYKESKHILKMIIVVGVIATLELVTPINAEHMSEISQNNIIKKNINSTTDISTLDLQTLKKIRGAYRYVYGYSAEEAYKCPYITVEQFEAIDERIRNLEYDMKSEDGDYDVYDDYYSNREYLRYRSNIYGEDISIYKSIYSGYGYADGKDIVLTDCIIKSDDQEIIVDINDIVTEAVRRDKLFGKIEAEDYVKENRFLTSKTKYRVGNDLKDVDLLITDFGIYYNSVTNEIQNIDLTVNILVK